MSSYGCSLRQACLSLLLFFLLGCRCQTSLLPAPSPKVIKVGFVAPFEGRYRHIGYDAVYAARLAVREINRAGGLDGWRIQLVAHDDRGNVEMARTAARNLCIDPDVMVVVGHYRPGTSVAAAEVYQASAMPQIVLGTWVPASTREGPLHLMPAPERLAEAMVAAGAGTMTSSVAIWAGEDGDATLAEALSRRVDAEVVTAPRGTSISDWDSVFSTLSPTRAGEGVQALRASGADARVVGGSELASPTFRLIGEAATVGSWFVTPYPFTQDVPDLGDWIAAYQAVGPHVPYPGPYALPTYDAVYLVAETVARVLAGGQDPGRDVVREALTSAQRSGILGEVSFDADGYWPGSALYTYRWDVDGPELVAVSP